MLREAGSRVSLPPVEKPVKNICLFIKKINVSFCIFPSSCRRPQTRRVQAARSQRREGRPRTWRQGWSGSWACSLCCNKIVKNMGNIKQYENVQKTENVSATLTSLSLKKPPAKTPKEPPNTEAENVQRPMS